MPYAHVNNTTLYYETTGTGLPLLLVHPPLLTSANFRYQLEELSDQFRVITMDIRGHGFSRYSKRPLRHEVIAEDMVALMNYLGIQQACVGGYSTGGSVALEALLAYPDRFIGGIMMSAMSEVSSFMLHSEIWTAVRLCHLDAKPLLAGAICFGNADNYHTFRRLYRNAMRGDMRNIRQYYRHSLTYRCSRRLHHISQPVLLLYGEKDREFHRYAHILHNRLPASELKWIAGAKHQLPTKAKEAIHEQIRDWTQRHQLFLQPTPKNTPAQLPAFLTQLEEIPASAQLHP